jgi:hypothetical protein
MRVRSLFFLCAASCLPIASTCPTSDPFPPPTIRAPSFTSMDVTGIKSGGAYQGAIHMQWTLTTSDSSPVKEFVILRKKTVRQRFWHIAPWDPRQHFQRLRRHRSQRPSSRPAFWKPVYINPLSYLRDRHVRPVGRHLGARQRPSHLDPTAVYPVDTLKENSIKWSTRAYQGGYFSYVLLWSDASGLLWTSPKPPEPTYGNATEDSFSVRLPTALYPLSPGKYYYGVKVEFPGVSIETIIIREFYAP